jgi:hypothetical protein
MEFILIILLLFIILSVILFIRGYSLVTRIERMEDILIKYDEREENTKAVLQLMLQQMREIDIRGSFEADDEVGVVFNELKTLIETYND